MSWDANVNDLFPHTVTLGAPGALNNYGRKAAPSTTSTRSALVEYKVRAVRKIDGAEVTSTIAVYLSGSGGTSGITTEWTLTLPDGTSRPILAVNRFADERGDLFEVVYLQ